MNSATMKLKSLWCSFFQVQNTYMITKSMKHIDASTLNNEDDLNEYRIRREKNNESVRKSRAKNRVKLQECAQTVQELKKENTQLNKQLDSLQSELFTLKGLFQHCFSFNLNNLAIKPSEIPTSALYKLIMKKEAPSQPMQQQQLQNSSEMNGFMVNDQSSYERELYSNSTSNKNDQFYIDQIKTALTSIVRQEGGSSTVALRADHDYSVKSTSSVGSL